MNAAPILYKAFTLEYFLIEHVFIFRINLLKFIYIYTFCITRRQTRRHRQQASLQDIVSHEFPGEMFLSKP